MISSYDFHKSVKRIRLVLFFIYCFGLFYLLFLSPYYGRSHEIQHYYNITPLKTIGNFIKYREFVEPRVFWTNLAGNILAFMPMGYFLPVLFRGLGTMIKVVLTGIQLSLYAEILQYLFKVGSFDVDDIILNTLGVLLGTIIYRFGNYLYKKTQTGSS